MHGNNLPASAGQAAPTPSVNDAPPLNWRALLKVHPAAECFPLLSATDPAAFEALVEDIRANGLVEPILIWQDPDTEERSLLDGRNRLDAMALAGMLDEKSTWDLPHEVRNVGDPYAIALSLNVHRRHIKTSVEKRELIAKVLKAKPEASNATIAEQTESSDKTVAKIRERLESTSDIPRLKKTVGKDGKARPVKAKKKKSVPIVVSSVPPARIEMVNGAKLEAKPVFATGSAEISIEQRRAEHAALGQNGAGATLDSVIEHDWHEAKRTLETLTAHPITQVAQMISAGEIALITEIADYLADLVTKLARTPVEDADKKRKAPTLIDCLKKRMAFAWAAASEDERKSFVEYLRDHLIPDDLSIPPCSQRGGAA